MQSYSYSPVYELYNFFDNFDEIGCIINDNDNIFSGGIDVEDEKLRSSFITFSTKKDTAV